MKSVRFVLAAIFALLLLLCLAVWLGGVPVVRAPAPATGEEAPQSETSLRGLVPNRKDFSPDALLLLSEVEARHPIFVIDGLLQNYGEVRAAYLQESAAPMTHTEFLLATQRYLTVLQDGHMGSGLTNTGDYLDISWVCVERRLYLLNEEGAPGNAEVTHIGGVPVSAVMEQVDRHYFSENEAARELNHSAFCRQREMLVLAGCAVEAATVILTIEGADERECGFRTMRRDFVRWGVVSAARYIVQTRTVDDVCIIDLRSFQQDPSVDRAAGAIRAAIRQGTRKFIFDLRGNLGGNSEVGAQLLHAMEMTLPQYGVYIRNSEKTREMTGAGPGYRTEGDPQYSPPNPSTAANPSDIALVVLTDEYTFSSATMTATWVRDGGLGTIIGRPSSNAPTAFGEMMSVTLPVSGLTLSISHKRFLRPDPAADPTVLQPDLLILRGEDAMQAALDFLAEK